MEHEMGPVVAFYRGGDLRPKPGQQVGVATRKQTEVMIVSIAVRRPILHWRKLDKPSLGTAIDLSLHRRFLFMYF
jgi:hypothetical protein